MAKIDKSLHLTESEIDQLMRSESRIRIATVGKNGRINLTPMTFGWTGGCVFIFGRGQKVANLRHNPEATVLVDVGDEWRDLQGIMMQGHAEILEDAQSEKASPHLQAAQLDLGRKHKLSKEGKTMPYKASASGRSRRWIVFTPDHIVTWNNQNLPT